MKQSKFSIVQRFCLFFYRHILFSASLWISVIVFGALSYGVFMQKQGFPNIEVPVSVVRADYFVNDKELVDREITKPLLETIQEQDNVTAVSATTTANNAIIVVEYEEGVTSQAGSDEIQRASEDITIPEQTTLSFEAINAAQFNNRYDVLLSVSSSELSYQELSVAAAGIADEIQSNIDNVEVESISPFEAGTNPLTGESVEQQSRFDWFGESNSENNGLIINPSVTVGIISPEGVDVIDFNAELEEVIESIRQTGQYDKVSVTISADFASTVEQQLNLLQGSLGAGLLIVVLICCVFIGWRAGLLAATGMLVSLLAAIGVLFAVGVTLNTITLFGLILALGLIVDDTIIMVEAVDAARKEKLSLPLSIRRAAKRIALASLAGTLTTILGFAPLLFITGILGEFIRVLPITIIVCLAVSLVVSLSFIPFAGRWLSSKPARKSPLDPIRKLEVKAAGFLSGIILSANTTRKKATRASLAILFSLVVIGATGPLFQQLQFDIFPPTKDSNTLLVEYSFLPQTTIEDAIEITQNANNIIADTQGEYVENLSYLGTANQRSAAMRIDLIPFTERNVTSHQLIESLDDSLADIGAGRISISQLDAGPPRDQYPFKVQIAADDPQKAQEAAGLLATHLNGLTLERQNNTSASISEVESVGEQQTIRRINGDRIVEVQAAFSDDDVSALVQLAQAEVEQFIENSENTAGLEPDSYKFDFGIESENQESFNGVLLAFPFLLIAMFILLVLQFRSIVQPILILFAVPFSFFGVALGLNLTNNPLSFFVMIGFFALIGLSVNNSILLTDYANQARRDGKSPREAVAFAVRERTRPLLTTTVTSVFALVPLTLSDPFWESLTVTIMFGLVSSAMLVLIAFPYYYLVLEAVRSRVNIKRLFTKKH